METGTFQSQHLHGDTETTQPSPPVSWKTLLDVAIPKGCGAAALSAVRAGFKSCTYGSKRSASAALTPASAKWARRFLAGDLLNVPPRRRAALGCAFRTGFLPPVASPRLYLPHTGSAISSALCMQGEARMGFPPRSSPLNSQHMEKNPNC